MSDHVITGRYTILHQVDAGGMGSVFKANDDNLGRTVAVKKINPELAGDPEAMSRFKQEAQTLAKLSNGNVAAVYDYGTEKGEPFLVMEFVEGVDLHKLIEEQGSLPIEVAAPLFCGILRGFVAVHNAGIVHRDIKPKNVIVSWSGEPKIIDFGIARLSGKSGFTQAGHTLGTPAYMSPEQIMGEEPTPVSDLYSLAVLLFEMLTGSPPFREGTGVPVQKAILQNPAPFLSSRRKGLPAKLDAITAKGLAKNREKRYRTADEFLQAVEGALPGGMCSSRSPVMACLAKLKEHQSVAGPEDVPGPTLYEAEADRGTRFAPRDEEEIKEGIWKRWRWVIVSVVGLLVVIGIGLGVLLSRRTPSQPPKPAAKAQPAPAASQPITAGQPPAPAAQPNPAAATPSGGNAAGATPPVAPVDTSKTDTPKADTAQTQNAEGATTQAVRSRPHAKQTKGLSEAEKARLDALKAFGRKSEEKKP